MFFDGIVSFIMELRVRGGEGYGTVYGDYDISAQQSN